MHATLAVTGAGLPLGVLGLDFDPQVKLSQEHEKRRKTQRWLDGFNDIANAVREVGGKTRVICVCDREADLFELFDAQRRRPRVELVARAKHDRVLAKRKPKLFAVMSGGDPDGLIDVEIEGLTARPKSSRKKARAPRQKRLASCELRFRRVMLPATHAVPGAEPVSLYAVHVREVAPPEGEEPVQWFLLSTVPVRTARDAAEIVGFYLQRRRIEDWFRILKSGCRVEFLLFRTAERLQRAIAINAVIAWRIMVMTLLGWQVPDCEPRLMFTDSATTMVICPTADTDCSRSSRATDVSHSTTDQRGNLHEQQNCQVGHRRRCRRDTDAQFRVCPNSGCGRPPGRSRVAQGRADVRSGGSGGRQGGSRGSPRSGR